MGRASGREGRARLTQRGDVGFQVPARDRRQATQRNLDLLRPPQHLGEEAGPDCEILGRRELLSSQPGVQLQHGPDCARIGLPERRLLRSIPYRRKDLGHVLPVVGREPPKVVRPISTYVRGRGVSRLSRIRAAASGIALA